MHLVGITTGSTISINDVRQQTEHFQSLVAIARCFLATILWRKGKPCSVCADELYNGSLGLGLLLCITPHRPDSHTFLGVLFNVNVRTYEVESTQCKLVEKNIIDLIHMV